MAIGDTKVAQLGGNQPCFHCCTKIEDYERVFYWVGPMGAIFMHLTCVLLWWMGGLSQDIETIRAEWASEIDA